MAINDVLSLKAARCNVTASLKSLGALGHQQLHFAGFIYIRYAVPPYSARTLSIAIVYRRWVKTPILFFWHLAKTITVLAPQF